jgi:hypothetical protein
LGGFVDDAAIPGSSTELIPSDINGSANSFTVKDTTAIPGDIGHDFQHEAMYSIAPIPNSIDAWPQLDYFFPSFFESIMVPEPNWVGTGEVQMPPDLMTVIPDYEEWPGSSDIFGLNFTTAIEQAMDPSQAIDGTFDGHIDVVANGVESANASTDNARQRHDIFKRSPW